MAQQAAFHFKILSVNRGDCVAGIPVVPSIPSEVGFTHPRDRGCWRGFGRNPWTIFACFLLEAASRSCGPRFFFWLLGSWLFVLGGGLVSPGWWGGGAPGGRGRRRSKSFLTQF